MTNNVLNQLSGQRFGKLIVIRRAERNTKSGNAMWVCQCDCGNESVVIGSHLRSGHTNSCGCNRLSDRSMGYSKERLYRIWTSMHRRCSNPSDHRYKWYGGRGISVCEEWESFLSFRSWAMTNGYNDDLTIDRIDKDGMYHPDNCQWVDMKVQANNRNNNRILWHKGNRYTATQLAEEYGMSPHTVFNRLKLGWNVDRIVNTPERREG